MTNSNMCAYYKEVNVNKCVLQTSSLAVSFLKAERGKAEIKEQLSYLTDPNRACGTRAKALLNLE